ncbi:alpha/beta hydrolase [Acetivibrio cellulolyticus]|uniref:alpha/beta hydrolase n=1 Tax=Acetivibrio cellulolyticus TaxID=35830 RepID=UPI0001E2FB88|nr:alpha/beta hydrolase [Acetivibrio cellulolyticus]
MSNTDNSKKNLKFKRTKRFFIVAITLYILVCIAAYFFQEKLIFSRQKLSGEVTALSTGINSTKDIELTMSDGITIRGWFLRNSTSNKSNLLIYFGGNAEEVSLLIPKMSKLQNWSVALINYRGYGTSEGTPGEKVLFSDSLEIYDYFANREDINKNNIVVMGRSVGTGIATFLSEKRPTSAVILVSPYDTLANVAKGKLPFLPVNLLLKHKFDSISRAPSIKSPLLIMVGTEDTLIPPRISKRLANAWCGKVQWEEILGKSHNSIDDGEIYLNKIRAFLSNVAGHS